MLSSIVWRLNCGCYHWQSSAGGKRVVPVRRLDTATDWQKRRGGGGERFVLARRFNTATAQRPGWLYRHVGWRFIHKKENLSPTGGHLYGLATDHERCRGRHSCKRFFSGQSVCAAHVKIITISLDVFVFQENLALLPPVLIFLYSTARCQGTPTEQLMMPVENRFVSTFVLLCTVCRWAGPRGGCWAGAGCDGLSWAEPDLGQFGDELWPRGPGLPQPLWGGHF